MLNLKTKEQLLAEARKEIKRANQRLLRIERKFDSARKWGGKRLLREVEAKVETAVTDKDRITVNKKMSEHDIRLVLQKVRSFNKSTESTTLSGIKETSEKIKAGLRRRLEADGAGGKKSKPISDEDVERFYQLFQDQSSLRDLIGDSDLWVIIREAQEKDDNLNEFAYRINTLVNIAENVNKSNAFDEMPDSDLKEEILDLYNTYLMR